MAPEVGIEPTTNRLTAGRSTAELLRNPRKRCADYIHVLAEVNAKTNNWSQKNNIPCKKALAPLELAGEAAILRPDS